MKHKHLNYLKNIILPALIFSFIVGILTGGVIVIYKFVSAHIIEFSQSIYAFLRTHLAYVPLAVLFLAALVFPISLLYKKAPDVRGGGIPTSIGILQGHFPVCWQKSFFGVLFSSLITFFIGVPLGNEGPCVEMGTALGKGTVKKFAKGRYAWDRYVMTGGACAGFTAATNSPIAGIMFAVEEAHQRISPMIIMVAFSSVVVSSATVRTLSGLLGIEADLFPALLGSIRTLNITQLWIPVVVGIVVGLFSVLFLKYYASICKLWNEKMKNVKLEIKVAIVFLSTLAFGLLSFSFISTGHDLVCDIFSGKIVWYALIAILIYRATATLCATSSGVTGGLFVPIIALGACISSLCANLLISTSLISADYYATIVALGITACLSGMMKTPLTAIAFALEALYCSENLLSIITVASIAFMMTEIFDVKSITENVIKTKTKDIYNGKEPIVIDTFVTVQSNTFAVGKQIRDIFWPANLFVLSIKRTKYNSAVVDEQGSRTIHEGDVLHLRYSCYDVDAAKADIISIIGEQEITAEVASEV